MVNWEYISADNVNKNKTIDWFQRDCSENVASWGYVCLALVNIYIYKGINKRAKNIYKAKGDDDVVGYRHTTRTMSMTSHCLGLSHVSVSSSSSYELQHALHMRSIMHCFVHSHSHSQCLRLSDTDTVVTGWRRCQCYNRYTLQSTAIVWLLDDLSQITICPRRCHKTERYVPKLYGRFVKKIEYLKLDNCQFVTLLFLTICHNL